VDKLRVLLLAEHCNPTWPSVPLVGYHQARALAGVANALQNTACIVRIWRVRRRSGQILGRLVLAIASIDAKFVHTRAFRSSASARCNQP
jgi:hypothetical protein